MTSWVGLLLGVLVFAPTIGGHKAYAYLAQIPRPPINLKSTYYVRRGLVRRGNGSQALPFSSIGEAIAAGATSRALVLEINVAPGTYRESINIARSTYISRWGTGNVNISGSVRNLVGASLSLTGIEIMNAPAVALDQSGGVLQLNEVVISGAEGVGIQLAGGVRANLNNVTFTGNKRGALSATGQGTRVWADTITATNNDPTLIVAPDPYCAAVQLGDGAKLWMKKFYFFNNRGGGFRVSGGATARIVQGTISTSTVQPGSAFQSGVNLIVDSLGIVEFDGIITARTDIGILVDHGYINGSSGEIRNNLVGVMQYDPVADLGNDTLMCINKPSIMFIDNVTKIGVGIMPIPDPIGNSPPPNCKTVPWVDWQ